MTMNQDKVFWDSEGDQWFSRNREAVTSITRPDPVMAIMRQYDLRPKSVLEIGASNGWRLSRIAGEFGSVCTAVEPSKKAIEDGKKRYKNITFKRGLAASLPVKSQYDLVILSFVLHWVARSELFKSMAEIERVVKPGGFIVIADFLPDQPAQVEYHHLKKGDAYTFKQHYSELFTSSCLFQLVSESVFDYASHGFSWVAESDQRCAVSLLSKTFNYQRRSL